MVHLSSANGGFDSLASVLSLFQHPGSTLTGWVHFLAFDLLVGWGITQHAVKSSMNRVLVVLCLLLTFMLGPIGLGLYGALRLGRRLIPGQHWVSQPGDSWRRMICGGHVILARCGFVLLLLLPVLYLAFVMDMRTTLDANVWLKPIKFSIALIVYVFSLSWYANYLPGTWREHRWFNYFTNIVVMAIALEMLWLIYAASIGEKAHFNTTHAILAPVYFLMGLMATILTAQAIVVGIGILRNKDALLKTLTRYSLAYGLITTFILTLVTAGYMSGAPAQSHAILPEGKSVYSETDALFFIGWLREVGDLRVSHFFATHAMHLVPLVGWFIAKIFHNRVGSNDILAKRIALLLCAFYGLFVLSLFFQALLGKSFL